MAIWIIEPRDPFIARDGRPFGAIPGGRAKTLPFPYPSTTTGGVRTREGLNKAGIFQKDEIEHVKNISVRGPLLVELDGNTDEIARWMAPAPYDALILEKEESEQEKQPNDKAMLKKLVPLMFKEGAKFSSVDNIALVGMPKPVQSKPSNRAPKYWFWEQFEEWLMQPEDMQIEIPDLGHSGPNTEVRNHVAIDPNTQASMDTALFQTTGLEFIQAESVINQRQALAMAVITVARNIKPGMAPLGGERRLVKWWKSNKELPVCPSKLKDDIIEHQSCRMVLLTPAIFDKGWNPQWITAKNEQVTAKVEAVALGRAQVISGWDLNIKKPKPTRRLVPAGSVYFLRLEGREESIGEWVDYMWMRCVSDQKQDRKDGFGMAVLGVWDGSFNKMEVQ